jgi:hypothetical protein
MLSKTEGSTRGGSAIRKPGAGEHKMRLRERHYCLGFLGPGRAGCFGGTGCLPRAPPGAASRTGGSSCVRVCL